MVDYSLPAEYPYKDEGVSGAETLNADDYNAVLAALVDLGGTSGRVKALEANPLVMADVTGAAVGDLLAVGPDSASFRTRTPTQVKTALGLAAVASSGSASDITTGTLPDSVIPSGIARDSETAAAVAAAVTALVNSAPSTRDTLKELSDQLDADESAAAALATTVGGKLAKASNLSDLVSALAARGNLAIGNAKVYGATPGRVISMLMDGVSASGSGNSWAVSAFGATPIPLAKVIDAQGGLYTNGAGIVIPAGGAGYYRADWSVRFTGGTTVGERAGNVRINNTTTLTAHDVQSANTFHATGSATIFLNDGDVVALEAYSQHAVTIQADFQNRTFLRLTKEARTAIQPIVVGWSGNETQITGAPHDAQNTWTARTSWSEVGNIDYVSSNTYFNGFVAANPSALTNFATALIPHDLAATGWNAALDEVIAGTRDSVFTTQGQKLAQYGSNDVVVRPWWEMNLDVSHVDATKFINAWNRAIPLIRSAFATAAPSKRLRVAFCYLPDASGSPEPYIPGSANYDVMDADIYAQQYQTTTPTLAQLLATVRSRLAYLSLLGAKYNKPVAMSEWGSMAVKTQGVTDTQGRGDVPEFIDMVFDWAEQNQAAYINYFNYSTGGVNQTLGDQPLSLARFNARAALL